MPKATYNLIDCKDQLKTSVNFTSNATIPFHRWYPFVEGFSENFIKGILNEVGTSDIRCIDPFAGSGTTPLVLQRSNIFCESYEVNPFMYLLSKSKLVTSYTENGLNETIKRLKSEIDHSFSSKTRLLTPPIMNSMIDNGKREKWLFHKDTMDGLLDIKYGISKINDSIYMNLCKVTFASILLNVSNVYRNGKCVSYKKNWKDTVVDRKSVIDIFFDRFEKIIISDICDYISSNSLSFSNAEFCKSGDVLKRLDKRDPGAFNLCITSPPYLNSRDYTDTYMIELWMLDLVTSYDDVRKLRNKTIKSHVQVKWENRELVNVDMLREAYNDVLCHKDDFWNISIPSMIAGYFDDMNTLFSLLCRHISSSGRVYFNVANSAYYGVHIKTDEIIARIAEQNGFEIEEIRLARQIKPSSQQKNDIDFLRESVIVLTRNDR